MYIGLTKIYRIVVCVFNYVLTFVPSSLPLLQEEGLGNDYLRVASSPGFPLLGTKTELFVPRRGKPGDDANLRVLHVVLVLCGFSTTGQSMENAVPLVAVEVCELYQGRIEPPEGMQHI